MTDVAFLLGREPGPDSVLPAVLRGLRRAGFNATLHLAGDPEWPRAVSGADLVVLRALSIETLEALRPLAHGGTRFCNQVEATLAARDKAVASRLLARAGVPAPPTTVVHRWADVGEVASRRSIVVKPVQGSRGHGVVFLTRSERGPAPWPGPYLVQDQVDHAGHDRKVYVVGTHMAGVLRPWPPMTLADKNGTAFVPSAEERQVAWAAGAALGLEIFGVDLLLGHDGPVVVDVNAFPGFKGVPGAARWLERHLAASARGQGVQRCTS